MSIRNSRDLKQEALSRLSNATGDPRKLVLIHTAVSLGAALLVAVITFLLQQKINTTGGLSGIGLRSMLTTGQSLLQMLMALLLPFWEIGIVYVAIRFARSQGATVQDLSAGFRMVGPVLRLKLGQIFLFGFVAMPCMFVSTGIFMLTPLSKGYVELMTPFVEQMMLTGQPVQLDTATAEAMMQTMLPMVPIFLIIYLVALLPLMYRLRMAEYVIMDGKTRSALFAMIASWRMTRGEAFSLLRLDLSFWWFYALSALVAVVAYGDQLLPLAGITLPISAEGAYFLFYGIYVLAQLLLYWRFAGYLHTTYALAYDRLRDRGQIPKLPTFSKVPWEPEQN